MSNMDENREANETDSLLSKLEQGSGDDTGEDHSGGGHRKTQSDDFSSIHISSRRSAKMRGRKTRHRKHMSSISEMIHNLEPVREEFAETGRALGRNFRGRLESMDRGDTGFFDMSVTRSLSILPDDLDELADEVGAYLTEEMTAPGPPPLQYLALFSAVVAVSSNSTALHLLDGVKAPLKLYWRMTASYCALLPFAMHSLQKDGFPKLNLSGWIIFGAAVTAYSIHGTLFVTALEYTTIGNTVIYANSQALLLIIGKACIGERVHWMEAIGVVVAFSGAVLCSVDSEGSSQEKHASTLAIFGDFLALGSAVMGVIYLTCAKTVRSEMSVILFMFSVMFFGSFLVLFYITLSDGRNLNFTMNPYTGVFGWLDMAKARLPVLIYLAVVVNIMGTMGFVRAMKYFDTVVIAVATLMEPLMASLIAVAFHAGLLPGPLGWLGNFLVVAGTLGVVYPSVGKGGGGMH